MKMFYTPLNPLDFVCVSYQLAVCTSPESPSCKHVHNKHYVPRARYDVHVDEAAWRAYICSILHAVLFTAGGDSPSVERHRKIVLNDMGNPLPSKRQFS